MKNKFITGVIIGGMVFGTVGAFAGQYVATENPFPVQLNGNNVSIEGYNIEGSTYFKLRDIADVIGGFNVGFDNNTIQLSKGSYSYSDTSSVTTAIYNYSGTEVPQYESITGAYCLGTDRTKSGRKFYRYKYDQNAINQYCDYLENHGFSLLLNENGAKSYTANSYKTAVMIFDASGLGEVWINPD